MLEFHAPPRFQAGAQGAQRSAEWRRERGSSAGHSRPPWGTLSPQTPTPSRRAERRDAWSRGCDASAGTFQEGWQRCGGTGAARRDRPRLLAPAHPEPGTGSARRQRRACRAPRHCGTRRREAHGPAEAEGTDGHRAANSPAQLAHQHASGLPADPAGRRRDHAGRTPYQRVHGRHAAAGSHAAAHQDDQAGDRTGQRAPGRSATCRPARLRNDAAAPADFKVTGPRTATDRARKAFLEATRDIPNTDEDAGPGEHPAPTRTRSPSRSTSSTASGPTRTSRASRPPSTVDKLQPADRRRC